ncbi:hypothetical protein RJ640_010301 [Escallonia rubra]|uniref:Protein SCAR n=1 Tax=Escallonia rubra TaxID=112253 RepID=A0AA88R2W5_9ASTE|nr:hypothetical protein RJ640_010301 [Escallonia rubra]
MPLSRYQIRNEFSLADPELYRAADKDDPEALLEGVAMAGLVGVLRQLGDLAEFAAEIFHDLHEEVTVTAARGHGLMVRVQQLEAEFPSIEKAFLSQTSHSSFFSNAGTDWHPNLHTNQNLITRGDLPRFVMDSYEESRGPPRLFLLDKFDVAGAGACLKRYTDPSFFKVEPSSYGMTYAEVQREKRARKAKKKGSRWRNGDTPEVLPSSHAKLHQLFLEERVEKGVSDPARLVKLKKRLNGFPFHSKVGRSYMEKFLNTPSPEDKEVREISIGSPSLKLPSNIPSESGLEILEINTVSSGKESVLKKNSPSSSPVLKPSLDEVHEDVTYEGISNLSSLEPNFGAGGVSSTCHKDVEEKEITVDEENKTDGSQDSYQSDDIASEIDSYMDALAIMESEVETDINFRFKNDLGDLNIAKDGTDSDAIEDQLQAHLSDSQSVGNSGDGNSDGNWISSFKGMSSFSYSDTSSTFAEKVPLDGSGSGKVFLSTESHEAENSGMSSYHVSFSEGIPVTQSPKQESLNGAYVEAAEIPNSGVGSVESLLTSVTDLGSEIIPEGAGAITTEGSLRRPELSERYSKQNELNSGAIDIEENVDFPPTVSGENHPADIIGDGDPNYGSVYSNFSHAALEKSAGAITAEGSSRGPELKEMYSNQNELDSDPINIEENVDFPPTVSGGNHPADSIGDGDPNYGSVYSNFSHAALEKSAGAITTEGSSRGPELKEIYSNQNELDSDPINIEENVDFPPTVSGGNHPADIIGDGDLNYGLVYSNFSHAALEKSAGAITTEGSSRGPELKERYSNQNDLDSDSINIEENVDFPPTVSGENHPADILEDGDPNYGSVYSNISHAALENSGSESLFDDVLQREYAGDNHTKNLVNSQTSSPHSAFNANEQPFVPALLEFATHESELNPDGRVVPVDDGIPSAGVRAVNLSPADSPKSRNSGEQLISETIDDGPALEVDSAEARNPGEAFSKADGEAVVGTNPSKNVDESDAASLEIPYALSDSEDPVLLTEVHVHLDEKTTEVVQSEDVVVAVAVASLDDDADGHDVDCPSANFGASQEGCLSSGEESVQIGLGTCGLENNRESSTQEETNQQAVVLPDLDPVLFPVVFHDSSDTGFLSNGPDSSLAAEGENNLHLDDPTTPLSSKNSYQGTEYKYSQQCDLNERIKDTTNDPTELSSSSEQKAELQADPLLEGLQSPNHVDHKRWFGANSETSGLYLPAQPCMPKVEFQTDQLENFESSSQLEQIQSPNYNNRERHFDSSSESCPPHASLLPSEASVSDQSGSLSLDVPEPATDLLRSVYPGFGLLPEVAPINLEEMPPLPPLPPVQWRIGKLQHASLTSERDAVQHDVSHFPPLFPSKVEEKPQTGHATVKLDIMQPSNPFSPLSPVKDDNTMHADQQSLDSVVHLAPFSLQMPSLSSHGSNQDAKLTSGGTQSMNPSLLLPAMYSEMPHHAFHVGEREDVQPTLNPFLLVTTSGDTASLHQIPPEASPDDKKLEQTSLISEAKAVNPPETSFPPTTIRDEQSHKVSLTSGGEIVWSSGISSVPSADDGNPNGHRPIKLPRPRSPLIDAVAAHDKRKLKKVTERVRPDIQKVDERDSLLEQIRTKSFNLKPAIATRPSIQGPKTNLKVAAILERANAIRQAFAGSDDEDDDADWSDS